jgi:hypothetical protein
MDEAECLQIVRVRWSGRHHLCLERLAKADFAPGDFSDDMIEMGLAKKKKKSPGREKLNETRGKMKKIWNR